MTTRRPLPPALNLMEVPCSICGSDVSYYGQRFHCIVCGISWDERGRDARWDDPEAEQCPATRFDREFQCPRRCLLTMGHEMGRMHIDVTGFWWE